MMKLFQYSIIHTSRNQETDKLEGTVLQDIKTILAEGENEITIIAAREIPEEYLTKLSEVQIVVRPF